jgi:endo-1,4-beta-xylanase
MRCSLTLSLKAAAGIIPVFFMGCSGSGSGLARDAGLATAGATAMGTGPSATAGTQPDTGSLGGVAGAIRSIGDTGVGGKTGGAGTTANAGTAGGGGGTSVSSPGGHRTGGSTSAAGGSSVGGTTVLGGSGVAGRTSSTGGTSNLGGAGGTSASAGATTVGTRTGPAFPARFVGNIDTAGSIRADFSKYWDQFTPENAGKWGSVQGSSSLTFNWKSLDAMYKYTEENNIIFKEMCFIWGAGQPSWINNDNVVEAAKAWMKAFCDRYPNTRLIDVVNQPLHYVPGYANGLGGGGRTTYEWVATSFKMAREACPNAVLIINDYNICEYEADHQKFLDLMTSVKTMDAPIDAIGCEGHDAAKVSVSKFKGYLDALAGKTGLPITITEFDIGLADDEKQRAQYADYFPMFWDNPNVKGVTVYGYITGKTWRDNTGIMSSDGTMRPAMTWLMDFLKR